MHAVTSNSIPWEFQLCVKQFPLKYLLHINNYAIQFKCANKWTEKQIRNIIGQTKMNWHISISYKLSIPQKTITPREGFVLTYPKFPCDPYQVKQCHRLQVPWSAFFSDYFHDQVMVKLLKYLLNILQRMQ